MTEDRWTSLSAALLSMQETTSRDRRAMTERIEHQFDKLDAKIDRGFEQVEVRLKSVCDKGGEEHAEMRARLSKLEQAAFHRAGQAQMAERLAQAGTFTLEHGWKLVLIGYFVLQGIVQLTPATANPVPAPITIHSRL